MRTTGMKNKATGLIRIRIETETENKTMKIFFPVFSEQIRNEKLIRRKLTNIDSESTENSSTRQNVEEMKTDIAAAK